MAKRVGPRRGSRAFRPRKRARKFNSRINALPEVSEPRLLDFVGFKVGMSQVSFVETRECPQKGAEVVKAVTLVEFPRSVCYGIRYMKSNQVLCDVLVQDQKILGELGIKKVEQNQKPSDFDSVRLLVYSRVKDIGIGQKKPIRYEIGIGSSDPKKQEQVATNFLGKEIKASDVFKRGEHVDIIAVTKGKGWQGVIKRFGVARQRPKATGKVRHLGTLGPWHPSYVMYTTPMAGQMGFHKRTEQNKRILDIVSDQKIISKVAPFHKYGVLKNEFLVLEGSVQGPQKRLLKLKLSYRNSNVIEPVELTGRMFFR